MLIYGSKIVSIVHITHGKVRLDRGVVNVVGNIGDLRIPIVLAGRCGGRALEGGHCGEA